MGGIFTKTASYVSQEDIVSIITDMTVNNMLNCTQIATSANTIIQTNSYCGNAINIIGNVNQSNDVVLNLDCIQSANTINMLTEDITSAIIAKVRTLDETLLGIGNQTIGQLTQKIRREIESVFTTNNITNMFQAFQSQNGIIQVNTNVPGDCKNIITGLNQSNVVNIITKSVADYSSVNQAAFNIANQINGDVSTTSTQTGALWALAGVLIALAVVIGVALFGSSLFLADVPLAFTKLINPLNWCK